MNNGVMNWWNNRSDEYYVNIQNGIDDIFDRADRAFPTEPHRGRFLVWFPLCGSEFTGFLRKILHLFSKMIR